MKRNKRRIVVLLVSLSLLIAAAVCAAGVVRRYYPLRHLDIIERYADEYGFEPEFICAVIHTESHFNKDAVSGKGASGLMQITESTAYWLAEKMHMEDFDYDQIFDPDLNIRMGCYYLQRLYTQYGDTDMALCAYNAGSGNVANWLSSPEYSKDGITLDIVPFEETRNYVKRIDDARKIYTYILKVYK